MMLTGWPKREGWRRLSIPVVLAHVVGTLMGVPMSFISVYALLAVLIAHPLTGLIGLGTLGLPSLMGLAQCLCSDWSLQSLFLVAYAYFSPAIVWIQPWAALTLRDQAWGSRRLPQAAAAPPQVTVAA